MSTNIPEFLDKIYREIGDQYIKSRLNVSQLYHAYLNQLSGQFKVDTHANRWAVSEFYANYARSFGIEDQVERKIHQQREKCWKRFCVTRLWELDGGGSGSGDSDSGDSSNGDGRKRELMSALLGALNKTWGEVVGVEMRRMQREGERLAKVNVIEGANDPNDTIMTGNASTNTTATTPVLPIPITIIKSSPSLHINTNPGTNDDHLTKILGYFSSLGPPIETIVIHISKLLSWLVMLFVNVVLCFPPLLPVTAAVVFFKLKWNSSEFFGKLLSRWVRSIAASCFGGKSSGWIKNMKSWFELRDVDEDADENGYADEDADENANGHHTYHNAGYDSYNWTSSFNHNESFIPSLLPQIENLQNVLRDLTKQWSKLQLGTTSTNIYNSDDAKNLDHIRRFRKYSDALITAGTTSTNTLRLILKDANRTLMKLERLIDRRLALPRNCMVAFWQGSEETPCISVSEWEQVWMVTLGLLGMGMIGWGIWSYCHCHRRRRQNSSSSSNSNSSSHPRCNWSRSFFLLGGGFFILGFPFLELLTLYQRAPSLVLAHSTHSLQEALSSYHTIQTSKIPSLLDLFVEITSCIEEIESETTGLQNTQQRLQHTTTKRDKELGASLWTWMPKKMTSRRYMEEVRVVKENERIFKGLEKKADGVGLEGGKVRKIVRRGKGWLEGMEDRGLMGERKGDVEGRDKWDDGMGVEEVEEWRELKGEIEWIREILYRLGQMVN
ncbi:hypothetical protein BELL_0852g00030 [Botrytis elliptica]|uniref:Uncharacterized protein n=1 Tax=Botrytis elliptica TaxID=278938 RepID=A0A4Z1J3C8_9HELO|nr:hypothetical protein BELL_0852g00030 [Botrytis elliptica]